MNRILSCLTLAFLLIFSINTTSAASKTVDNGNWDNGASWDSPPGAPDGAEIYHNIHVTADASAGWVDIWGGLQIDGGSQLTVTGGVTNGEALTVYGTLEAGFLDNAFNKTTTIASGGTISATGEVDNKGILDVHGTLNMGHLLLSASGTLNVSGTVNILPEFGNPSYNRGQTTIFSGGAVKIDSSHEFYVVDGKLTIDGGTFDHAAWASSLFIGDQWGSGELEMRSGTLNAYAAYLGNNSTATLSGGTMNISNKLDVKDDVVLTVSGATINHSGSGTQTFEIRDRAKLNFSSGTINMTNPAGVLVIKDNAVANLTGGTLNTGKISLSDSSSTSFDGTNVNVGTLEKTGGTFSFTNGTLNAGTIEFHDTFVQQGGTLSPGGNGAIGTTTITGAYNFTGGTIYLDVNPNAVSSAFPGTTTFAAGTYSDLFTVNGYTDFSAAPTWEVNFLSTVNPARFAEGNYTFVFPLVNLSGGWGGSLSLPSGTGWALRSEGNEIFLDYSFTGTRSGNFIWVAPGDSGQLKAGSSWDIGAAPDPGDTGFINNGRNNTILPDDGTDDGGYAKLNFHLNVSGSDTKVSVGTQMRIGHGGVGKLTIGDGAEFKATARFRVGFESDGELIINNGGKFFTENGDDNIIGHSSYTGTVTVNSGGQYDVRSRATTLGWHTDSIGNLIVNGGNAQLGNTSVGYAGTGTLEVKNGGTATVDGWLYTNNYGDGANVSKAFITLSGNDSTLTVNGELATNRTQGTETTINLSGAGSKMTINGEFTTNRQPNSKTTVNISNGANLTVTGAFQPFKEMGGSGLFTFTMTNASLDVTGELRGGTDGGTSPLSGDYAAYFTFGENSTALFRDEAWFGGHAKTYVEVHPNATITSLRACAGVGCGANDSRINMLGGTFKVVDFCIGWGGERGLMDQSGGTVNSNTFRLTDNSTMNFTGGTINTNSLQATTAGFQFAGGTLSARSINFALAQNGANSVLSPNTVTLEGYDSESNRFNGGIAIADIGTTTINGGYTLTNGTIRLDVDLNAINLGNRAGANTSLTAGTHNDLVSVINGNTTFTSGTLGLNFMNSMDTSGLTNGDTFTYQLMSLSNWNTADFANLTVTGFSAGSGWSVNPQNDGIYLTYTYSDGGTPDYIWKTNHTGNFLDGNSWSDNVAPSAGVTAKVIDGTNTVADNAVIDGFRLDVTGGDTTMNENLNLKTTAGNASLNLSGADTKLTVRGNFTAPADGYEASVKLSEGATMTVEGSFSPLTTNAGLFTLDMENATLRVKGNFHGGNNDRTPLGSAPTIDGEQYAAYYYFKNGSKLDVDGEVWLELASKAYVEIHDGAEITSRQNNSGIWGASGARSLLKMTGGTFNAKSFHVGYANGEATMKQSGGTVNADNFRIDGNGILEFSGGTINVANHFTKDGQFDFTGGTLNARYVDFALTQNGSGSILSPGGNGVFGTTTIDGGYVLTNGTVQLDVNLSGFSPYSTIGATKYWIGQSDLVQAAGDITFTENSLLDLVFVGSLPTQNDVPAGETWEISYQLMALTGEWIGSEFLESNLSNIWSYLDFVDNDGLYLTYRIAGADTPGGDGVPEPATWALMLMGLGGLYVWRRKSHRHG